MAYFILLLMCIPFIIYVIKYSFSRLVVEDYSKIHPDASIIHISHEKDNWGKYKHIKTIVEFADGVEYHTYKCRSEPGFGYTRYVVDAEVVEEIVEKAIVAHRKLAAKHSSKTQTNQSFSAGDVMLPEEISTEFSDFPEDFLKVVCNWINQWRKSHASTCKHSTYDYLKALESCGNGRRRENGLQTCQTIYDGKMLFGRDSINHMMKQLDDVLMCKDDTKRIELEDKVLVGLQGFRMAEMMRTGKF